MKYSRRFAMVRVLCLFVPLSMCFLFLHKAVVCADQVQIFPQFVSGNGWRSNLYCTNRGTTTASAVQVSFFDDSGSPLVVETNLGTQSNFSFSIAPGLSALLGTSSSGNPSVGYSVLTYPESALISCSEIFRYEENGAVVSELGVQPQASSRRLNTQGQIRRGS